MTTKDYLNQINRLNRMINNKISEISQLRELAYSVSSIKNEEKVQTSIKPDSIGCTIAKLEEMEKDIDRTIDEYRDKKCKIISQIDGMEDENYYNILFSRYIEKKSFELIATEMSFSYRNITRLHGKALKAFELKYGETYLKLS
nr:MAG TPA: Protein of unknown function (DUF1492) [Bacteriophage sp.]